MNELLDTDNYLNYLQHYRKLGNKLLNEIRKEDIVNFSLIWEYLEHMDRLNILINHIEQIEQLDEKNS